MERTQVKVVGGSSHIMYLTLHVELPLSPHISFDSSGHFRIPDSRIAIRSASNLDPPYSRRIIPCNASFGTFDGVISSHTLVLRVESE